MIKIFLLLVVLLAHEIECRVFFREEFFQSADKS